MRTSVDTINEKGLQYQPRRSSRHPAAHPVTDADFADDIALLSDNLENAQGRPSSVESAENCTGIHLNEKKTECMPINIQGDFQIRTHTNNVLKRVDDYKYHIYSPPATFLSWKNHPPVETIYGNLPRISSILMKRRVQFAGHCFRASDELASSFVLWRLPSSHKRSRKLTFPDTICRDTSIANEDLFVAMTDRTYWKSVVSGPQDDDDDIQNTRVINRPITYLFKYLKLCYYVYLA